MRVFAIIIILLLCIACEHKIPMRNGVSFQEASSVLFKASRLYIIFDDNQYLIKENINTYITLKKFVQEWVNARIKIDGNGDKNLKVTVKEFSITKIDEVLDNSKILASLLTKPSEVYKSNLSISLEFYLPDSLFPANIMTISASCTKSLAKNALIYEREQFFEDIIKRLMTDIDIEFNKNVNIYLGELTTF
ncbi:MAG: hypothetical protein AB8U25_02420 [Rickettsiales endosymbiont of Dermacentor nuttalli]